MEYYHQRNAECNDDFFFSFIISLCCTTCIRIRDFCILLFFSPVNRRAFACLIGQTSSVCYFMIINQHRHFWIIFRNLLSHIYFLLECSLAEADFFTAIAQQNVAFLSTIHKIRSSTNRISINKTAHIRFCLANFSFHCFFPSSLCWKTYEQKYNRNLFASNTFRIEIFESSFADEAYDKE